MPKQEPLSRHRLRFPVLITLGALGAFFFIAYAADSFMSSLVQYAGKTFDFMPAAIAKAAMPFLIVTMALAFAWLLLVRLPPSSAAAGIVLAAGIILIAIYLPFLSFPLWLRQTPIGRLRYAIWSWTLGGYLSLYYMGSSCVVIGIAALLRRLVPPSKVTSTE